ncbi:MAG: DUF2007 domain-containing protein [Gammaproteobacteria bacterium]|nr:DUF2007 domain-containing protein [Gammaproteobacteria bacterium]
MKKLYTTQNKVALYVLKSMLDEKGIESFIKNEQPPLAGEIPPAIAWPELWVMDDERFSEAAAIFADEKLEFEKPKSSWTCAHCGEVLEGQFDVCWKCGASRIL